MNAPTWAYWRFRCSPGFPNPPKRGLLPDSTGSLQAFDDEDDVIQALIGHVCTRFLYTAKPFAGMSVLASETWRT